MLKEGTAEGEGAWREQSKDEDEGSRSRSRRVAFLMFMDTIGRA